MDQTQCFNCGGMKVTVTRSITEPLTGKTRYEREIGELEDNLEAWVWGVILLPLGGLGLLFIFMAINNQMQAKTLRRHFEAGPRHHEFYCQICGQAWQWDDNQPYNFPKYAGGNERLLHMGSIRLQQEEEELQRLRMAAAAEHERRLKEGKD